MPTRTDYLILKRKLFDKYYGKLNEKQRQAVYTINGPLLILAGAGSGKTTVLVSRIAHIIRYGNAYLSEYVPENYLSVYSEMETALRDFEKEKLGEYLLSFRENPAPAFSVMGITFTNKAANEIKTRLVSLFGEGCSEANEICAGTFHSICVRFLRRYIDEPGYDGNFIICDAADSKKEITDCMKEMNIDDKMLPAKSVMGEISRAKDRLMGPEEYALSIGNDYRKKKCAEIYSVYQKRLREENMLDFDDIIMMMVRLLERNADVREKLQSRFRYISVDEYQDTNYAQLRLTLLLSGRYQNIMVVGDEDQSIYKFRGAEIKNILNFDKNYDKTKVIRLEENYRSTSTILDAANSLIKNNTSRLGKTLWTSGEKGSKIAVRNLNTQNDEADFIAREILDGIIKEKRQYRDFAVLYRMNTQSRNIEQVLTKSGIPYRMLGGTRFFDRAEVKDIISYLQTVNNPRSILHLTRIYNQPRRGIGEKSFKSAILLSEEFNMLPLDFMKEASKYTAIPKAAANSMRAFSLMIDNFRESASKYTLPDFIRYVIAESGYEEMILSIPDVKERTEREKNIEELISAAAEYSSSDEAASLSGFLEDVALVSDTDKYDESANAVVLMTVHSAKGLEFPVVFLPGLEENIFPSYLSVENESDVEEERRLCYVAITRAKEKLYISYVNDRMLNGQTQYNLPSRFLKEIPDSLKDIKETPKRPSPFSSYASSFGNRGGGYAGSERYNARLGMMGFNEYNEAQRIINESFDSDTSYSPKTDIARYSSGISSVKKKEKGKIEAMEIGDTVIHAAFGKGTVLSVKKMGADFLYEIAFDDAGTKKLMASYAKLTKE